MGLVKGGEGAYIKREPRFLRPTETRAGTARFAPPSTRLPTPLIFDPVSVAPDTGSTAIWRQTPEAGRVPARRARSKADATWLIPPFTLAGVMRRADARRAAVQKLYSRRVPGSQRKRRVRQGYGPGKQPTRNCSPSSGRKSPITGGFSSVDTGSKATARTTAAQ